MPVGVVGDPLIPAAGSNCGGSPCCPEPLNTTGGIAPTIFYPAAYANVTSAGGDQLPELTGVAATWGEARTLDVPVALPCPAVLRGTAGCLARHVITLTPAGRSPLSIVVSVDASRLAWLSPSTPVRLTLKRIGTTANLAHLEVVRASDGAVVLAVFADAPTSNATEVTAAGAPLRFARSAAPYCVARLQAPCNRTLAAYSLSVTAGCAPVEIAPASATGETSCSAPTTSRRTRPSKWCARRLRPRTP